MNLLLNKINKLSTKELRNIQIKLKTKYVLNNDLQLTISKYLHNYWILHLLKKSIGFHGTVNKYKNIIPCAIDEFEQYYYKKYDNDSKSKQ